MHNFSTIGDNWEVFLMRNGFSQAIPTTNPLPTTNPNLDKPSFEDQFGNSISGLEFTDKTPLVKESPCKLSTTRCIEKNTDELNGNDTLVPTDDASLKVIVKSDAKKLCKRTRPQYTILDFKNKKVGRLIYWKLRNQNDTHHRSIDPINIDEDSDLEIEDFLVREDPELHDFRREITGPTEPYDFVSNFPPCLKVKEGFSDIRHNLKKTIDKTDAPMADYLLHQPTTSLIHYDGCFEWIERYYIDIPLLQDKIKTLTAHNGLMKQEILDLKAHAGKETKSIKRSRNIVVKNVTNVKEIINSEWIDPYLVNF